MQAYQIKGLQNANSQAASYMHISAHQGTLMVLCANIGASFLLLANIIGGSFQTSAWFVIVLGGLLGIVSCSLIHAAYQKTKAQSFEGLLQHAFGKVLGTLLSFFYRMASLFRAGITIGIFACSVKGLILPQHTYTTICLFICAALFFVLRCDAITSARVCSIGMLFFAAALLLMLTCIPAMHSAYVLPFTLPKTSQLSDMIFYALFCASGADIMIYLYPGLQKNPCRSGMIGSLLGCAAKLFALYIACSIFGFYAISAYAWPSISMYKANNLINIDNPELIFMILFTLISLTPAHLYASAAIRMEKNNPRRDMVQSLFATIVLFLVSMAVKSIHQIPQLLQFLGVLFCIVGLLLPLATLLFSVCKRRI